MPPGADFPAQLVQGLKQRLAGSPPEAMARVTLYVNTTRMKRRIVEIFVAGGASFLPRIRNRRRRREPRRRTADTSLS